MSDGLFEYERACDRAVRPEPDRRPLSDRLAAVLRETLKRRNWPDRLNTEARAALAAYDAATRRR